MKMLRLADFPGSLAVGPNIRAKIARRNPTTTTALTT